MNRAFKIDPFQSKGIFGVILGYNQGIESLSSIWPEWYPKITCKIRLRFEYEQNLQKWFLPRLTEGFCEQIFPSLGE